MIKIEHNRGIKAERTRVIKIERNANTDRIKK